MRLNNIFIGLLSIFVFYGCGGGGGGSPEPDIPQVASLSFSSSATEVDKGDSITLSWSTSGLTSCSAFSEPNNTFSGSIPLSGSQEVTITTAGNHNFLINCSGNNGNKAIKDIYGNKQINADPFLLGKNFVDVDLNKIKNDFGESFSQSIKNMELNKWVGPIKSPYGHHIVFISNYKDGYFPEISMVLKQVEIDLLQLRRDSAIQKYLEEIQSEYKIYINPELTF